MTRDEAHAEAARLNREMDRAQTAHWFAREGDDGWRVVKLGGVPNSRKADHTTTEAKPRPPMADDPRPALWRNVGGPYGGG